MTNDKCSATCNDGSACNAYSVTGEDKCRMHLGKSGDSHDGENNGNYDHGAFSEHFRSDLTDDEQGALEAMINHLQSIDDERSLAAEVAAEALLKYKRSGDSRFMREARQWFSEFNLLPNEEHVDVSGSGIVINMDNDE